MSQNIENKVNLGKITYRDRLLIANKRRNYIMDVMREVTHSIGLSFAKDEKPEGKTARYILSHYAITEHVEKTIELPSHLSSDEKKRLFVNRLKKRRRIYRLLNKRKCI